MSVIPALEISTLTPFCLFPRLQSWPRVALIACLCVNAPMPVAAQPAIAQDQCRLAGPLVRIPELPEASGVALSRRSPERLRAHNDSGAPVLLALTTRGAVTGRVRLQGVKIDDWEAVAVGPCPGGNCVYVGDIGDNNAKRAQITIHRIVEPINEKGVAAAETFHATYPDGAHDAETLLVAPDGGLYIVTKGDTGPIALYRFPRDLRPGATHSLERVGQPRGAAKVPEPERITDGAVSADGSWVVLRTKERLTFYRGAEFLAGNWLEAVRVPLKAAGEPQGEGVTVAPDGTVYLTGEGGGKSQAGTLTQVKCILGKS